MKIWRLEARNGVGVFHSGVLYRMPWSIRENGRARDPYRHPHPEEEGLDFDDSWFCGFASLAQYRLWFNTKDQRKWLSRAGVVLKQYEVASKHVQRGKAQVIFQIRHAKHVASRKPSAA